jgi:diacylglycerol kinase (ATP)
MTRFWIGRYHKFGIKSANQKTFVATNDLLDELMANPRLIVISRNPHSGKSTSQERVAELRRQLVAAGYRVEVPDSVDEVCALAEQGLKAGELRAVIAGGGDGTLNMLVNKLSPAVPFLGFPLGTENLVAKYLGWSADPHRVCNLLQSGVSVDLDAGQANGQIFLVMFSCGLDADIVHRLHAARRGHITHASYLKPIVQALGCYKYPSFQIEFSPNSKELSATEAHSARWLFISNLPNYAGQVGISPAATPTDGLLDWCAFQAGSFGRSLGYLIWVLLRQHPKLRDCRTGLGSEFEITSTEPNGSQVPYQIDGDPGGFLPVAIQVLPGRFRAIVDQQWSPKALCS